MLDMPGVARANHPDAAGRPQPSQGPARRLGSGRVAHMLDIAYVALNPGAGVHGRHDRLVNHLGNEPPRTLLRLHEEHPVALAHDWANVADPPMAAVRHDNPAQAMNAVLAGAVAVRVLPGCGADMQGAPTKEATPDRG